MIKNAVISAAWDDNADLILVYSAEVDGKWYRHGLNLGGLTTAEMGKRLQGWGYALEVFDKLHDTENKNEMETKYQSLWQIDVQNKKLDAGKNKL